MKNLLKKAVYAALLVSTIVPSGMQANWLNRVQAIAQTSFGSLKKHPFKTGKVAAAVGVALLGWKVIVPEVKKFKKRKLYAEFYDIVAGAKFNNEKVSDNPKKFKKAKQLLASGADTRDMLQEAVINNDETLVQLLLDSGVDVNRADGFYPSALMIAAREGYEGIVRFLLQAGANVNVGEDTTPLLVAVQYGYEDIVRLLLESRDIDLNRDYEGIRERVTTLTVTKHKRDIYLSDCTVLMWAVRLGYKNIVELLLQRGAYVDQKNSIGCTALMEAARYGFLDIVKLLLAYGADASLSTDKSILRSFELFHKMKISWWTERGSINGILGALPGSNDKGMTSLMLASAYGHQSVVELLLSQNDVAIDLKNDAGWSALMFAAAYGHLEIACMLLERGADPENVKSRGEEDIFGDIQNEKNAFDLIRIFYGDYDPISGLLRLSESKDVRKKKCAAFKAKMIEVIEQRNNNN